MTALTADGVCKGVVLPSGERLELLRDVTFAVARGESVAVIGRSGSGKSTLLAVLGLLTTHDRGRVTIGGREVERLSDRERARMRNRQIGFVFQGYSLVHHLTAAENVGLPFLQGAAVPRATVRKAVANALDTVGLSHRAQSRPRQLSGGEQQRTAIARAIVRAPDVLLADEPTGALDTTTAASVLQALIDAARKDGTALIVVTHDPVVAARADRVLTLSGGILEESADAVHAASR